MTAYLSYVQTVVPYLDKTHHLIGDDVEDEDVQGVVACIDKEALAPSLAGVYPPANIVGHQESENGRHGE